MFCFLPRSSKDRAPGGFLCESAVSNVGPHRPGPVGSVACGAEHELHLDLVGGLNKRAEASWCRRLMQVRICNSETEDHLQAGCWWVNE